jgi:hypothetical protein
LSKTFDVRTDNSSWTLGIKDKMAGTYTIGGSSRPTSELVHPAFYLLKLLTMWQEINTPQTPIVIVIDFGYFDQYKTKGYRNHMANENSPESIRGALKMNI